MVIHAMCVFMFVCLFVCVGGWVNVLMQVCMCVSPYNYVRVCIQVVTHYLVKWKSLPYEESTWELLEDIDPMKVQAYHSLLDPPRSVLEVCMHVYTYMQCTCGWGGILQGFRHPPWT